MLDHATLRTHDLEGTRAFFEDVLDLKPGYRPAFTFPGYWLYAEGAPIVHLIFGRPGRAAVSRDVQSREAIDHVGFQLTGYANYRKKLDRLGVSYSQMELPELGERRLFVRTPTGILLELVFRKPRPTPHSDGEAGHA
jgi:catechol 2,3-dioxygenase-like lactoylglutathione lyase family enzyme